MMVDALLSIEPGLTDVLSRIGDTPLLRLRRVVRDVPDGVEIYAKCEHLNPGGSVKDRPALAMVLDGERRGLLTPGKTILDATSGNTGIAYAMIGAARGYGVTLCVPKNASLGRKRILRAYGAELIETGRPRGGGKRSPAWTSCVEMSRLSISLVI